MPGEHPPRDSAGWKQPRTSAAHLRPGSRWVINPPAPIEVFKTFQAAYGTSP